MSSVCGNCVHWQPSLVPGKCNKGHSDRYGIEVCNYCKDYQTTEQYRIAELEAERDEYKRKWVACKTQLNDFAKVAFSEDTFDEQVLKESE